MNKASITNLLNHEHIEVEIITSISFPNKTLEKNENKKRLMEQEVIVNKKKKLKWTDETNFTIKSHNFCRNQSQIPQKSKLY